MSRLVRAGLFLIFAVLLGIGTPVQPALSAELAMRSEIKTQVTEHRDGENLRQRPASAVPSRSERRRLDRTDLLPKGMQPEVLAKRLESIGVQRSLAFADPAVEHARSRHAPAALQIYRH